MAGWRGERHHQRFDRLDTTLPTLSGTRSPAVDDPVRASCTRQVGFDVECEIATPNRSIVRPAICRVSRLAQRKRTLESNCHSRPRMACVDATTKD